MTRIAFRILPILLAFVPACGGGGGGGGPTVPAIAPTTLGFSSGEVFATSGVALDSVTATVDGDPVTFSISPALPAGLTLNPSSGTISGTPTVPAPRRVYDVTASNTGGSVHARIALRVVAPARFVYSTSTSDNSISTLAVDTLTGELRRVSQTIAGGIESGPEKLVFTPNGRAAYAPNLHTSNVSVFSVDPLSGWLDRRAPIGCGTGPHELAIDPTGRYAYVVSRGSNDLHAFRIHATTGDLTPIVAPIAAGTEPTDLVVDPTGKFLFVTLHGDAGGVGSAVEVFALNPNNGAPASTGNRLFLQGGMPIAISIDTVKPLLFVTLEAFQSLLPIEFDAETGSLSPLTLLSTGAKPTSIDVTQDGGFAYVTGENDGLLHAYRVDAATNELSGVANYPAGSAPTKVVVEPTGRFAFVVARDSAELRTYEIDALTGQLAPRSTLFVRGAPTDVAIVTGDHPTRTVPRFAHAASAFSDDITCYTVNPQNGALTQTSVAVTGDMPSSIAVDPRRRWAWVSNSFSFSISSYSVNGTTGALTANQPTLDVVGKPTHLIVDPTGRFLYETAHDVLQLDDGFLRTYAIGSTSGALTLIDSKEVGLNPTSLSIDPTGRFLYTANHGTGFPGTSSISVFAVDPSTGIPTSTAPNAPAPGVFDLAFLPDGRTLYAVLEDSNSIVRYSISRSSGALTAEPPLASAGTQPVGLVVSPNGRFGYSCALDELGSGSFAMHTLAADGTLSDPVQTILDGLHPYDIAIDATGRFLYTANSGSNSLSVVELDPLTGVMTLGVPVASGNGVGAVVITSVTQ